MNIAILVKMKCKRFKSSSLIMSVVHSKRRKRNKYIGYVEAFSSFLNVYEKAIPPKKLLAKRNLHAEYRGDKHFYPTLLFNDGIGLCDSLSEEQKNILQKKIMSNVEKIKLELQERFGPADAVEVSRDNKGRLNMKYPCPYKICQSKEHELKRHFMRKNMAGQKRKQL